MVVVERSAAAEKQEEKEAACCMLGLPLGTRIEMSCPPLFTSEIDQDYRKFSILDDCLR